MIRGLLILCCFIVCSCARQDKQAVTVKIDLDSELMKPISSQSIFTNISIIPLDDSVIVSNGSYSSPSSIALGDDVFYVLDERTFDIDIFDYSGKFIGLIGHVGRGPGEYNLAQGIFFDKEDSTIEVLDPTGRIFKYSTEHVGDLKGVLDLRQELHAANDYIKLPGQDYLFFSISGDNKICMYKALDGDVHGINLPLSEWQFIYNYVPKPLITDGNKYFFFQSFDGALVNLDLKANRTSTYLYWDFGKHKQSRDNIPSGKTAEFYYNYIGENTDKYASPFIFEGVSNNLVVANFVYRGKPHSLLYHTDTQELHVFYETEERMQFMPTTIEDGYAFMLVEPDNLDKYVDTSLMDAHSKMLFNERRSHQNSYLIVYRFK